MPILFYGVIGFLLFGSTVSWTAQYFGGGEADSYADMWFLNWWPFALAHHINPFVTSYQWSPHGDNLTWDASVPFAALLCWPLTMLGGAGFSFNVLSVSAPVISAWTAFLLARYLTRDWAASIVGGYLFGFSTYELGQMVGHLNLDLIWLVPVALLMAVARVRRDIGRGMYVFCLAAIMFCQIGLSTEVLASLSIFSCLLWMILFIIGEPPLRLVLLRVALETGLAGAIALTCALPFLIYLFRGLGDLPEQLNSVTENSADLLNFIVPTVITRFGQVQFAAVASRFTSNPIEQGAYLGLPLIMILIWYVASSVRTRMALVLPAMMFVLVLCSLGPVLQVAGIRTQLMMPWAAMVRLPLIKAALPTRFTMYVSLCAGLMVALWLAAPCRREWRIFRFMAAILACVALLPSEGSFPWLPLPEDGFFQPGHELAALGADADVLVLPFSADGAADYWQVESRMQFTQAGGYLGYVPHREAEMGVVDDLVNAHTDPAFDSEFADYCGTHGVRYVLIGPDAEPALTTAVLAEGWKKHVDAGVIVISVPSRSGAPGDLPSAANGG